MKLRRIKFFTKGGEKASFRAIHTGPKKRAKIKPITLDARKTTRILKALIKKIGKRKIITMT